MGHDKLHAAEHIDGTDDIQSATNAQKGLATASHITTLEALDALAAVQEYHTISASDVTNGFFTLAQSPADLEEVLVAEVGGTIQVSKQGTNLGTLTPDFDILNGNELHFNNNGAATGLSGDIIENDVLMIKYRY